MTEFRTFCIGAFVTSGLFAALVNRGAIAMPGSAYDQLACVALIGGCVAVSLFGKRGAE